MANLAYNAPSMDTNVQPPSPRQPWPFTSKQLSDELVALGHLPLEVVAAALAEATSTGSSLVTTLLARNVITEEALRDAMAQIYKLPVAEIDEDEIAEDPVPDFPVELARAQLIVPLRLDGDRLRIAVADPTRASALREIHDIVGHTLDLELATQSELVRIVRDLYSPRITVKLPDGTKTSIVLPPGDLKIGRAEHNELIIRDPEISTTHAIIRGRGAVYQIVDLGSRNGVFVNGERIHEPHTLHNGDRVQLGRVQLRFKWPYQDHGRVETEEEVKEKETKSSERLRAAYISAASRIISQMLGAAALITLGLLLSGGLPSSCSTVGETSTKASSTAVGHRHSSLNATVTMRGLPDSRTTEYQSRPSRRTSRTAEPSGTPNSR